MDTPQVTPALLDGIREQVGDDPQHWRPLLLDALPSPLCIPLLASESRQALTLVLALIQGEEQGVHVADILKRQAAHIRQVRVAQDEADEGVRPALPDDAALALPGPAVDRGEDGGLRGLGTEAADEPEPDGADRHHDAPPAAPVAEAVPATAPSMASPSS